MTSQSKNKILPVSIIFILLLLWFVLSLFYSWIKFINFYPNPPTIFPISVLYPSDSNTFSIIPLGLMLGIVFFFLKTQPKQILLVYLCSLALIVLGNLLQGGYYEGFITPLIGHSIKQPFYDATQGFGTLGAFAFVHKYNEIQILLTNHASTHPPFIVVLWNLLSRIHGVDSVAIGSVLIVSLIFPVFYRTLRLLDMSAVNAGKFTLLLALIPAVNIYSILTYDAIASLGYFLFLFGVISIYKQRLRWQNLFILATGFILANSFVFLAFGLIGILILLGIWQYLLIRRIDFFHAVILVIILFSFILLIWKIGFGYDHISAFITTMRLESARYSTYGLYSKLNIYLFSRIEDIGEILLFLSFGVLAVVITPTYNPTKKNLKSFSAVLFYSALILLIIYFLFGVATTGETARIFFWIVPYFLIFLMDIKEGTLNALIGLAAIQTITMQLSASYYW